MSDRQLSVGGTTDGKHYVVTFPFDPLRREFELAVTLRTPPVNTRIPLADIPTYEELEVIEARTILNWSNVMFSYLFDKPLPEGRVAGIRAIRIDDRSPELSGVPESDGDMPYCTVLNITNFYKPGICITIHSYDDGTEALALAKAHRGGIDRFNAYIAKNAEMNNGGVVRVGSVESSTQTTPTPDNDNRIGRNADSLPDTPNNVMNMPTIEGTGLRPAMLAPTGSTQGDVMYASGKGDTAWKFAFWATKKIDYNNKYAIQYGKDEIRAYPLRSVEITDFKGSIKATIKTQLGNIDIWKKKKDSDENSIDWIVFVDAMAGIGVLAPQLVVGFKKSIEAIALFAISHSDDGTKEYKNLRDFRAMPQMSNTRPHDDWDTFESQPKIDIPF